MTLVSWRRTTSGASAVMKSAKPLERMERRPLTFHVMHFMGGWERGGVGWERRKWGSEALGGMIFDSAGEMERGGLGISG